VTLSRVPDLTPEVRDLLADAVAAVNSKRGGRALLHDMRRGSSAEALASTLVRDGALWQERDDDAVVGLCVYRDRIIEALYVVPARRRQGVARSMVSALMALPCAPIDALALPGDRAMKSLYESVGWKARLLTMRGE
jgi:GNAT superfamily N-acetyltransferase